MAKVRAKFVCNDIKDHSDYGYKGVSLVPVIDGSEENKSFSKYTPSGLVELNISYETEASNAFEVGKEYYIDFTEA